jgi:hypothetical protein
VTVYRVAPLDTEKVPHAWFTYVCPECWEIIWKNAYAPFLEILMQAGVVPVEGSCADGDRGES